MDKINIEKIVGVKEKIMKINPSLIKSQFYYSCGNVMGFNGDDSIPYEFNKTNTNIFKTILRYFSGQENFNEFGVIQGNASLSKGLLVSGGLGVGKSLLFKILQQAGREIYKQTGNPRMHFIDISCGNFVNAYMFSTKADHLDFDLNKYEIGQLYIDDLGVEPLCFNSYELMEQILFERHRNGATTFITTNLTPEEICNRYGDRIGDRLNQMFNIITWNGKSFRDDL